MLRIALLLVLSAITVAMQLTVVQAIGLGTSVMLPLVFLVYLSFSDERGIASWLAISTGFLLDLYSPFSFGIHMVGLVAVVFVTRALFLNFFTNRSIYAILLLTIAGTLVHLIIWFGGGMLLALFGFSTLTPSWKLVSPWQFVGNLCTAAAVFYGLLIVRSLLGKYFFQRKSF